MRWLTSFASLLWFAAFVHAQDAIPQELVLKGDTSVIKVARLITVYDERQAVKSFPFTVEAPKGAVRPSWSVPVGVSWQAKKNILTVTAAPKGEVTITAEWSVIDFEKKETRDEIGSIKFIIGDTPLPPDPPKPPPSTPLQKDLQAAYDADLDFDKLAKIGKFADILDGAVGAAKAGGKVKTAGEFVALTKQATDMAIGAGSIPTLRKAVGAYLVTVLPREANTPASDAYFAKAASEHGYIAMTLRTIGGAK